MKDARPVCLTAQDVGKDGCIWPWCNRAVTTAGWPAASRTSPGHCCAGARQRAGSVDWWAGRLASRYRWCQTAGLTSCICTTCSISASSAGRSARCSGALPGLLNRSLRQALRGAWRGLLSPASEAPSAPSPRSYVQCAWQRLAGPRRGMGHPGRIRRPVPRIRHARPPARHARHPRRSDGRLCRRRAVQHGRLRHIDRQRDGQPLYRRSRGRPLRRAPGRHGRGRLQERLADRDQRATRRGTVHPVQGQHLDRTRRP